MINIEYPAPNFRVKQEEGKEWIFDALRKKWVVLTPEEWVRQNFIQYLIQMKNYPVSLMAIERELKIGSVKRRFDILIFDREQKPWLMVECKSMETSLDEKVFEQLLHYNLAVPVPYLVITNGNECMAWERSSNGITDLIKIPDFVGV